MRLELSQEEKAECWDKFLLELKRECLRSAYQYRPPLVSRTSVLIEVRDMITRVLFTVSK